MMRSETIARACHEANRVLTQLVGDVPVQPPWDESPEEMRSSSIRGVEFAMANPNATPEDQHEAWCADKRAAGWVHGAVKDSAAKTHPALVPYDQLAPGTRAKDAMFRAIVRARVAAP
jgi:hypothetical protein